jgi:nicotinate-nucleotide adenylyltransferase
MIIGSDSLVNLPKWKNINYLSYSYKFIVAKRPGIIINKNTKYLDRCIFINKDAEDISSARIRKLIKEDDKIASSLLDKKVYDYIVQNKLYG